MELIKMEKMSVKPKRISVSEKRQITIPMEYYKALGIENEVECIMKNNCIVIRAVKQDDNEISERILQDIIKEGYKQEDILKEFRKRKAKVRPAIEQMMLEADKVAEEEENYTVLEDLFSEED
ncbi:MAG: AbrB/MazE/SpoVT family DNA-binding domain-containing protein, partial [Bacilli bacterium]|nr:AbrB/MazE/SpoVT family DNA-binding domain-containing protein [Bacilli bacterium]